MFCGFSQKVSRTLDSASLEAPTNSSPATRNIGMGQRPGYRDGGLHETRLSSSRMLVHSALPCKHVRISCFPALGVGRLPSAICISLAAKSRCISSCILIRPSTPALRYTTCLLPLTVPLSRSLSAFANIRYTTHSSHRKEYLCAYSSVRYIITHRNLRLRHLSLGSFHPVLEAAW